MKAKTRYRLTTAGKKLVLIMVLLCIAVITAVGSIMITSATEKRNEPSDVRLYSSITLQDNDTLWNLAKKYHGDDESVDEYIANIKVMNGLKGSMIHTGKNITYYYYGNAD